MDCAKYLSVYPGTLVQLSDTGVCVGDCVGCFVGDRVGDAVAATGEPFGTPPSQ